MSARTEEIRARVEKATPGHWWWTGDVKGNRALSTRRTSPWRDVISVDDDGYLVVRGGDMAFLSHAKADAEYLLTELTALREEVERLKGALESIASQLCSCTNTRAPDWHSERCWKRKAIEALSPSPAQQEKKQD